jgi:hypothetical protein
VELQYNGQRFENLEEVFLHIVGRQEKSLNWL